MATVLCVGTFGPAYPSRASLPFVTALVASESGNHAQIALMGDATCLMKRDVAEGVHAAEWPPLTDLLEKVVDLDIPVFV